MEIKITDNYETVKTAAKESCDEYLCDILRDHVFMSCKSISAAISEEVLARLLERKTTITVTEK